jgi:hypothetical protein
LTFVKALDDLEESYSLDDLFHTWPEGWFLSPTGLHQGPQSIVHGFPKAAFIGWPALQFGRMPVLTRKATVELRGMSANGGQRDCLGRTSIIKQANQYTSLARLGSHASSSSGAIHLGFPHLSFDMDLTDASINLVGPKSVIRTRPSSSINIFAWSQQKTISYSDIVEYLTILHHADRRSRMEIHHALSDL